MNKMISIIIPCYNDALYVEQAINSALNQTYSNKEVIVIDDGSDTKTKSILKVLEPKITKLITQDNKGQSTARNTGIRAAKGDYIITLDSDDFFEPSFCEKAMVLIQADDNIKIVSCFAIIVYHNKPTELFKPSGGNIIEFLFTSGVMGSSFFRKKDWNQAGEYDESMRAGFEDWEFYIRLLKDGGRAVIIEEPLFNYRRRSGSTTAFANQKKYELQHYIFNKHKSLYHANFEATVSYLLYEARINKINELKRLKSIDYRLGHVFLRPFRYIKQLFI